ncbi:L,D-transpeptidase family protein [Enterocloster bolteae]|uniref:L,D-transpeptidase family protein n=1 Tax=Enterocloster bolteae TaxID=208479 RepID=UPI00210AED53|nr:L,D-transpeptidase family protein [Enterocloster bolteae]MCQ5142784.1 L,D-transpeptidase/peptidoglycan binding protein [Enterocloster bolteae]
MQKLRKRTWMGRLAAAVMAAAVLVLAGAFVSLADEGGDTTRFVSGTKVNGVGVGGLTVDEAKARIEGFYAGEYNLTIRERGGRQETIAGTDIGYKVEVPEGLKAILDAQNAAGRVSGPDADNSHTMAMTVTYSQEALGAKIKALTLISGSGITVTSDARISSYEEGQPFSIIPAVQGNNVDEAKTTEVITAAVKAGQNSVDVDSAGCYYQVNIWETDENLMALCSRMNQYRDMSVNYVFGSETETLGGETIATWITGSQDGVPAVDLEKITAFVAEMASRRDTAGTARVFHTATGRDVELTGPYGWKIDVAGEVQALAALIQAGPAAGPVDREPVYAKTAASRTAPDWGTTYAEVDLTGQHVYMFQEGNLVWDAPCVTGNISKNYDTPPGIYSLTYKEKDRILRGAKKADGTYEYESHVDYWMPFNGGIGFHDATWRSKFGGTIFQTSGSHGCINLPPEKASVLYDLIYKGMPVLCYQ